MASSNDEKTQHSLMSDKAILRALKEDTIVIEPFIHDHLSTTSYDVTLGPYFYRECEPEPGNGTI